MVWTFDADSKEARIEKECVPVGKCWYFHGYTGNFLEKSLLQRKSAAKAGIVVITCQIDSASGILKAKPDVELAGFFCSQDQQIQIKKEISSKAKELFEEWKVKISNEFTREEMVSHAGRRIVRKWFDIKPLVIVRFLE